MNQPQGDSELAGPITSSAVQDRLRRDVEILAAGPRHRAVAGSLTGAREHCSSQLQAAGWSVSEQTFTTSPALRMSDAGRPGIPIALRWVPALQGINVVASASGPPQAGDTYLLAHLDTVRKSPGADDNASGVAVALEVARQLSGQAHRVVIVLTDLEELGLLGARHLLRAQPRPGLVVCLDAVGYYDDTERSQALPAGLGLVLPDVAQAVRDRARRGDFLLVTHRDSSATFARHLQSAAERQGLATVTLRDPRWAGRGQQYTRWLNPVLMDLDRSDHAPFWRARVPAVFLSGTAMLRNRSYHRANDTSQTLDYPRMAALAATLTTSLLAD
ncbi:M28 family peptidase [Cellulosimicrobium cellulans]|uniref:M28 family peptidase n=1 Tax=Cellulosimicrobium cellulans TaxID=1710 RepID=UPI000683F86A|nr:M28 family peptidase [Cellulosimicrobium cellulans]